jgi:hypothetical protein
MLTLAAAGTVQAGATTVNGTVQSFREAWREATVLLKVTAAATLAGDTLDVYVDTTYDGGLTFINLGHFTQVLGNGGAKTIAMTLRNDSPGATDTVDVSADAVAGATRLLGMGGALRYRAISVGTGSFTFGVSALMK